MVPLGLCPVLVATFVLTLTPQAWTKYALGEAAIPDAQSQGNKSKVIACSRGEYPHPAGTHCCNRCHKGTYVAKHCSRPGQATKCNDCPSGEFTAMDNALTRCHQCQACYLGPWFDQVERTPCTVEEDTVCGCRDNYYQTQQSTTFSCKKCSLCHNGSILQSCSKLRDTVCTCSSGFFLNKNNCQPCSSCIEKECKTVCTPMEPVHTTSRPPLPYVTPVLITLIIILGFGFVLLLAVKRIKQFLGTELSSPWYSSCVSPKQPKKQPVPEVVVHEYKVNNRLLETPPKEEVIPENAVSAGQELPDCVNAARMTRLPDDPAVLYTVVDSVPPLRWKEFVRLLGLSDFVIDRVELERRPIREAQYEMLRQWRLRMGHNATVECISCVLNQMELSGCSEAVQEALPRQP